MGIHKNHRLKCAALMIGAIYLLAQPLTARADEQQNPYEIPAQKASIPQNQPSNIERTITAQLSAIIDRDAALAYSFMSDKSHANYDSASDFLSDMRFKFGAIYNHVDVEFLHNYKNGVTSVQKVELKDRYTGGSTTVVYKLILQGTDQWFIDSFAVIETEEAQPI